MPRERKCAFFSCRNALSEGGSGSLCGDHSEKEWYSVSEAAEIWNASERSVRDWINPRDIVSAERSGRRSYVIPAEEFTKPHPAQRPRPVETEHMVTVEPSTSSLRIRPAWVWVAIVLVVAVVSGVVALLGVSRSSPEEDEVAGIASSGQFIGDNPLSVDFGGWMPSEPLLMMVGQQTSLQVELTNTSGIAGEFFAAVSLRDPEGNWVDVRPLIPLYLEPGETGKASWEYSPRLKGAWDVVYGVWSSWEDGQEPQGAIGNTGILEDHIVVFRQCIENAAAPGLVSLDGYEPFSPKQVRVGEDALLSLSLTNTGDDARDFAGGVTVWRSGDKDELVGDYRTDLDAPLEPGHSASFDWKHTLDSPGTYQLMFTVWDASGDVALLLAPCPRERLVTAFSPTAPKITGINPDQPRVSTARQWISVEGENFTEESSVVLSILGNSYPISDDRTEFVHVDTLRAHVGLTDPGTWSAQVINPGDEESNLFDFKVLP